RNQLLAVPLEGGVAGVDLDRVMSDSTGDSLDQAVDQCPGGLEDYDPCLGPECENLAGDVEREGGLPRTCFPENREVVPICRQADVLASRTTDHDAAKTGGVTGPIR